MFLSLFAVNLAPLKFSSLEPQLAPETAWRPSRHVDLPLFFLSCPLFLSFFFLFPFFSSFFFQSFSLSVSFPLLFSFFLAPPLVTPEGLSLQNPPQIRPCLYVLFIHPSPYASYFSFSSLLESFSLYYRRCCLLTFLAYFFDFLLVKHPPMPYRLILCVSKTF